MLTICLWKLTIEIQQILISQGNTLNQYQEIVLLECIKLQIKEKAKLSRKTVIGKKESIYLFMKRRNGLKKEKNFIQKLLN